jgi:glutathione S-transferase
MKLYSGRLSLFSRKVEIALHEKGLPFERQMVAFNQETGYSPKHPDVLAINPKGQVPVLVDGELSLYDSTIILEYLEDAYPHPPLYPSTPPLRALCRQLELYADEVMIMPLRALMHRTGPRPADPKVWIELEANAKAAESALSRHLQELNQKLGGNEYLCGALSAADIVIFMSVLFDLRLGGPSLSDYRALRDWYARLSARPAFAVVAGEIAAADLELSYPLAGEAIAP